jgi:acetyl esterase
MKPDSFFHPDMRPLLEARKGLPAATTPEEMRRAWTLYARTLAAPRPAEIATEDRALPTPGQDVAVRIYHPPGTEGPLPCIVYMHGGGFMLGDLDSSDTSAWGLCIDVGAVVVSVAYRLTPEHPYPAAFDDCFGVLQWLALHAAEIGGDPARLAVSGESAGGNLAAALALAARDSGGPSLRACAMVYPCTGEETALPSYIEYKDGPSLTTPRMEMYTDTYCSGARYRRAPYASPAYATDFSDLPPTFVHTAECDPIRDDGRRYAAKIVQAGGNVTYREAKRMLHGFLRARLTGAGARAEHEALCAFLRTHLLVT